MRATSRLFGAIVLAGSALGAGCRTPPWPASDDAGAADAASLTDLAQPLCPPECANQDFAVGNPRCYPCFI